MQDPIEFQRRRKVADALRLFGGVALGGVALLAGFSLWHLIRRGRLLRDRLGPPRPPGRDPS